MSARKLLRPCERCCPVLTEEERASGRFRRQPRACFERLYPEADGRVLYRCNNCGQDYRLTPRPATAGGKRQARLVERVREIAGSRKVEVCAPFRPTDPEVRLVVKTEAWYAAARPGSPWRSTAGPRASRRLR